MTMETECYICGEQLLGRSCVIPSDDEAFTRILGKTESRQIFICPGCKKKFEDALEFQRQFEAIQSSLQNLHSRRKRSNTEGSGPGSLECDSGRHDLGNASAQAVQTPTMPCEEDQSLNNDQHREIPRLKSQRAPSEHSLHLEDSTFKPDESLPDETNAQFFTTLEALNVREHHLQFPNRLKVHEEQEESKCKYCGERFPDVKDLNKHLELYHREERPFACDYCSKSFKMRQNVRTHMKIHVGPWDHVCETCGKEFTTRYNLASHLRNHPNGKCKKVIIGEAELDYLRKSGYNKESFVQIKHVSVNSTRMIAEPVLDNADETMENELTFMDQKHTLEDSNGKEDVSFSANDVDSWIKCKECEDMLENEESLSLHLEEVHGAVRTFACEVFDKRFKTKDNLKSNMRTPTGHKAFFCHDCDKGFIQQGDLNQHKDSYPNGGCKKVFLNEEQITYHGFDKWNIVESHGDEESFESKDEVYVTNDGMRDERKEVPNAEKDPNLKYGDEDKLLIDEDVDLPDHTSSERQRWSGYICKGCKETYPTRRLLVEHQDKVHITDCPFQCPVCGLRYRRKHYLTVHLRSHSPEKCHRCNMCGKGFVYDRLLKAHLRENPDEKCRRSIINSEVIKAQLIVQDVDEAECDSQDTGTGEENVNSEMQTGGFKDQVTANDGTKQMVEDCGTSDEVLTNIKHFQCDICSSRFTKKDHLKKHLKIHSNERSHVCESCDKRFITNSQLTNHRRTYPGGSCKTKKKVLLSLDQIKAHGLDKSETVKTYLESIINDAASTSMTLNGDDEICADSGNTNAQVGQNNTPTESVVVKTECLTDGSTEGESPSWKQVVVKEEFLSLYLCFMCNFQFTSCKSLAAHRRDVHNDEKPFHCNLCDEQFEENQELVEHQLRNHGDSLHKCLICNQIFVEKSALRKHLLTNPVGACRRAVVKIGPIPKEYSEKVKKDLKRFSEGESSEGSSAILKLPVDKHCPYCSSKLANRDTLRKHIKNVHTDIRPFQCLKCGKGFKRNEHLREHLMIHEKREIDPESEGILRSLKPKNVSKTCVHCGKMLANNDCLRKHIVAAHTNIRPYSCDKCGKSFLRKDQLRQHLATHEVSRKYGKKSKPRVILNTKCMYCGKQLKTRDSLKKHIATVHTDNRPFKCDLCSKAFKRRDHLDEHRLTHSTEKRYKCEKCKKSYGYSLSLKNHQLKFPNGECAVGVNILSCEKCKKVFPNNYKLQQHLKKHTGQKDFKCDQCGKEFFDKGNWKKHLMIHNEEKKFLCTVCGAQFVRKSGLENHMMVHSDEKPHPCPQCPQRFPYTTSLKRHIRTQHCNDRPYECKDCGKSFKQVNNLNVHRRQHTGEKPYVCDTCGERFMYRGGFTQHMRIHTGARPYNCPHCPEAFSKYYTLKTHVRIHTGERPLSCTHCDMTFTQHGSLKRHEKTHAKEKYHLCSLCGTSFTRKDALDKHMKSHFQSDGSVVEPCREENEQSFGSYQTRISDCPPEMSVDSENRISEPSLAGVIPYIGVI